MEFWLQKDNAGKFQLPVKPSDFTVAVTHRNTVVNVISVGDVNLIGKTGLREITLSSFFQLRIITLAIMQTEKLLKPM